MIAERLREGFTYRTRKGTLVVYCGPDPRFGRGHQFRYAKNDCFLFIANEGIADLTELPAEIVTWYAVAERMPEAGELVIGYHSGWMDDITQVVYYDRQHGKECWWTAEGSPLDDPENEEGQDRMPPTHWCVFPSEPKLP